MHRTLLLTILVALAIAAPAVASTSRGHAAAPSGSKAPHVSVRTTFRQGRSLVHSILDYYAKATDGHLTLGGCRHHERLWTVCRARIDYRHATTRYRFQISGNDDIGWVVGTVIRTFGR